MARPAAFLDRDGVLNAYLPGDYVKTPEELTLLPGAADAVKRLNDLGYPVFVISNQQGVAKALMTDVDLARVNAKLNAAVRGAGGEIEHTYYCTHHKDDACACRKPNAGMLLCAAEENDLDLPASIFIGDTETDAQAARAAGVGTFVLVLSGKFAGRPEAAQDTSRFPTPPDFVAPDLAEAVTWISGLRK
jgi:D-glycero-D-manno-heptose 1,7-bisphosphate phosphatase